MDLNVSSSSVKDTFSDESSRNNTASQLSTSPSESKKTDNCSTISDTESISETTRPLALCSFIVNRPKLALGVTAGFHLSLLLVTVAMVFGGYDILPVEFGVVPLDLTDHPTYLREQAWINRDNNAMVLQRQISIEPTIVRGETLDVLQLIFESENILTKENLKSIAKLEQELTTVPGYDKICQVTESGTCVPPQSIVRFFDGTLPGPTFYDPEFASISSVLQAAQTDNILSSLLDFHTGKDFIIKNSTNTAHTTKTRSLIFFGSPLMEIDGEIVTNENDKLKDFLNEKYRSRLNEIVKDGFEGMDVVYFSSTLYSDDIGLQVNSDLLLAAGSFTFIFIFVLIQTQSLFISTMAIMSILTSFTGANLIYRVIFDYKYFGIFHVLSVFIILGIGADDIFVFYDTWRATSHQKHLSLAHRLSSCYRRASLSMLITSLTTMIAFLANAVSPLLAIGSFGLFSGILVFVNYLSVITFFPCVVIVHHFYWEKWTWPCCRRCPIKRQMTKVSDSKQDLTQSKETSKQKGPVVRFCAGPYFRFITHRIARWAILSFFAIFLGCFIYFATTLKPDEESVRIYKPDHNYERALKKSRSSFRATSEDRMVQVYIIWGLKPQDITNCHKTDFQDCEGETIWDNSFDLNPNPAQISIQNLCHRIQQLSDVENQALRIKRNSVSGLLEVSCFLDNMESFFQRESYNLSLPDLVFPLSERGVVELMKVKPDIYNQTTITKYFYRQFETGMAYWLANGYSGSTSRDQDLFSELLGESVDEFNTNSIFINETEYQYGTRLRYAAIVVNTTLEQGNIGYETGLPIVQAWEDFVTKQMEKLPESVSGAFQCTPNGNNLWHWLYVQKTLANNAVQGIIIGISLAFPVLVLATQNFIVGFLATVTIGGITVTVVGIIPVAGWKLGVLESLNLSLVVGLSVDYVVHLAEGYHLSKATDRLGRVQDMLEHVGVSVISGAFTTVGASFFMLFAQILFFMQFAIFMFCTIAFSLLFSLLGFTTLLAVIGPQGQVGSIKPIFNWIKNKIIGRKSDDVDCKSCNGKGFLSKLPDG